MPTAIEPSARLTAFTCPHCHALAKQFWHGVYMQEFEKDSTPNIVVRDNIDWSEVDDAEVRKSLQAWSERMSDGLPFEAVGKQSEYVKSLYNVCISKCYNCDRLALWLYDRMLWPVRGNAPYANADLPSDIRADYDEAATIVELSPRGAAALLRLALQKLCVHLGEHGKNINDDIGALVSKGLDVRVQQALDVVRVVGNNAVHPGQIDLKDDRSTASQLFTLINLVADIMISQPKHVSAMFDGLPTEAKDAINKRDKGKP